MPCIYRRTKSPANAGLVKSLERETGVEPATSTLARSRSTTELLPLGSEDYNIASGYPKSTTEAQSHKGNLATNRLVESRTSEDARAYISPSAWPRWLWR